MEIPVPRNRPRTTDAPKRTLPVYVRHIDRREFGVTCTVPPHPPIGLYVHVPFCVSKCAYCDFASYAGREADIPRYVDAVVREITRRGAETGHPKADTIFLGGGTPSLLDEFQVTRILDALFEAFPIEEGAEITCECNPGTAHDALLRQALRAQSGC